MNFLFRALFAAFLMSAVGAQTLPLPVCLAFNDGAGPAVPGHSYCRAYAETSFVVPGPMTVQRVDVFADVSGVAVNVLVRDEATGVWSWGNAPPQFGAAWQSIGLLAPVTLTPGGTCTLQFWGTPPTLQASAIVTLYGKLSGPTPFVVTSNCSGSPLSSCTFQPPCNAPPATYNLMLRLRGSGCTGGSTPFSTSIGTGCGSPAPTLAVASAQLPLVGNANFGLLLVAPTSLGSQAELYFAFGHDPAGVPFEMGHPCRAYLDAATFQLNLSLGYEPLRSTTLASPGWFVPLPIPDDAALVGVVVTFQALVFGPGGVPLSFAPGLLVSVSNAVEIVIGY
jgi:hypothetical protein